MKSTARRTAIDLGLVVAARDGARQDVRVEFTPEAPTHELLAALAEEAGLDGDVPAARRGGHELPADAPLAELDLRHGDEISFGDEPAAPTVPAIAELVVVGGPQAGRRVPLPPGVHRVGREASIAIDDPSLSAQHLVLTIDADGAASVADAGSRNGTLVEGVTVPAGEERQLQAGELVQAGRTLLSVEAPSIGPPDAPVDGAGRVPFNRPPRVQRPLEPSTRPFPAPPADPQRSRLPLGASLIPLVLGIGLYARHEAADHAALLAPLAGDGASRRTSRTGAAGGRASSGTRGSTVAGSPRCATSSAVERREEVAPSARHGRRPPPSCFGGAHRLEPALWERRPDDPDFLELRVGSADLPSLLTVRLDPGGSEALRAEAEELAAWYATVAVGAGDGAARRARRRRPLRPARTCRGARRLARRPGRGSPLARASSLIAAAIAPGRRADWEWLKWLPHAERGVRTTARDQTCRRSRRRLGRCWRRCAGSSRRGGADSEGSYGAGSRRSRACTSCSCSTRRSRPSAPSSRDVLAGAASTAVAVLWLGRERRDLPGEAPGIVELEPRLARLTVTDAPRRRETRRRLRRRARRRARARARARRSRRSGRPGAARRRRAFPSASGSLDLLGDDEVDADWVGGTLVGRHGRDSARRSVSPRQRPLLGRPARGRPARPRRRHDRRRQERAAPDADRLARRRRTRPTGSRSCSSTTRAARRSRTASRLPHTVGLVTDLDAHLTQRALALAERRAAAARAHAPRRGREGPRRHGARDPATARRPAS